MPAENCYYVYLLTNWNNKVMYVVSPTISEDGYTNTRTNC